MCVCVIWKANCTCRTRERILPSEPPWTQCFANFSYDSPNKVCEALFPYSRRKIVQSAAGSVSNLCRLRETTETRMHTTLACSEKEGRIKMSDKLQLCHNN